MVMWVSVNAGGGLIIRGSNNITIGEGTVTLSSGQVYYRM